MLLSFLACAADPPPAGSGPADTAAEVAVDTADTDTGADPSTPTGATSWPSTSTGTAPTSTAPFVATFTAEPYGDAVAVRSTVPRSVGDCAAIPGAPCDDLDLDGLPDAWEAGILDRLRPVLVFDESEPLVDDPDAVLAIVARVTPDPGSDHVRVYLMLGYHRDYGRCGLSGHDGDSERVVLDLAPLPDGPGDAGVVGAYTAAHEDTIEDHGRLFDGADLGLLSFPPDPTDGQPRWKVFASDGKHATYGTLDLCESASVIPCVDEDCGADGVDPALFVRLPPVFDAGEPDAPHLTDLGPVGFPGDDAWLDQDFCGGQGRGLACSAPVRDKLVDDPF